MTQPITKQVDGPSGRSRNMCDSVAWAHDAGGYTTHDGAPNVAVSVTTFYLRPAVLYALRLRDRRRPTREDRRISAATWNSITWCFYAPFGKAIPLDAVTHISVGGPFVPIDDWTMDDVAVAA